METGAIRLTFNQSEGVMICPECRNEIPEGSKFCKECGRKIDFTCSRCGKIVPQDSKFLLESGHDLSQSVSPKDFPKID